MDNIINEVKDITNKPYQRYERLDQILTEIKILAPTYFDGICMSDEYKDKVRDIDNTIIRFPVEYICDTSPQFRDVRNVNNNITKSKRRDTFKIEDYLDYVVYYARKKLIGNRNLRKNFNTFDLINTCYEVSSFVKEGAERCDLECHIIRIDPGFDSDARLLNGMGYHYFNIIKYQDKYYLVDVSYSQFFTKRLTNFSRMGVPFIIPPMTGSYMVLDNYRNKVATIINKFGWIELTDEVIKAYFDGFALSYRNALYYEGKRLLYKTKYTAKDYKNFLIGEDSQVHYEGTRVLGYQREPIKNPYRNYTKRK